MNNWGLVIGLVLAVIFVIVILLIALPPLIQFQKDEAQRKLIDNLDDSHRLMCGTPDQLGIIFDRLDSISSDKFDNKAKGIYQKIQWGKNIESCDIIYLYNQLDVEQKKQLNWLELSCNVNHCQTD
ncbi:MAG: hypothetical protein ACQ9CV_00940 [Nitrosopumilus sp.]|jgi:hypothetical protein